MANAMHQQLCNARNECRTKAQPLPSGGRYGTPAPGLEPKRCPLQRVQQVQWQQGTHLSIWVQQVQWQQGSHQHRTLHYT